jgi:hypothetical protein
MPSPIEDSAVRSADAFRTIVSAPRRPPRSCCRARPYVAPDRVSGLVFDLLEHLGRELHAADDLAALAGCERERCSLAAIRAVAPPQGTRPVSGSHGGYIIGQEHA